MSPSGFPCSAKASIVIDLYVKRGTWFNQIEEKNVVSWGGLILELGRGHCVVQTASKCTNWMGVLR